MSTNRNPIQIHISSTIDRIDGFKTIVHYTELTVSYVNEGIAGRIFFASPAELLMLLVALDYVVKTNRDYYNDAVQVYKDELRTGSFYYAIDAGDGFLAINTHHDLEVLRDTISDFRNPKTK